MESIEQNPKLEIHFQTVHRDGKRVSIVSFGDTEVCVTGRPADGNAFWNGAKAAARHDPLPYLELSGSSQQRAWQQTRHRLLREGYRAYQQAAKLQQ
jgi:hypothetical protein